MIGIVGMRWWGPGPEDFAACAEKYAVIPVVIADLANPIDRRALKVNALSNVVSSLRVRRTSLPITHSVVLSPHRVAPSAFRWLRSRGPVDAWLGDRPEGDRTPLVDFDQYRLVAAAEPSWAEGSVDLPWPHLVPRGQLRGDPAEPSGPFVIVGTGYQQRVDLATALRERGKGVRIIGRGWPADFQAEMPRPRLETLHRLRELGAIVLNVPHEQMARTLNPFFFDLAAAGVSQIYIGQPQSRRGLNVLTSSGSAEVLADYVLEVDRRDLLDRARELRRDVLIRHSVDARLEELL